MKKDTVVIGVGNILLSDEGIGVHLVRELSAKAGEYKNIEFIDAGTGGVSIIHHMANRRKAIIIDSARMGTDAGTIRRFTPEDVQSIKTLSSYSMHGADILRIIEMSAKLGQYPKQIIIFGIEPERIEPSEQLSSILAEKLDDYVNVVLDEIGS